MEVKNKLILFFQKNFLFCALCLFFALTLSALLDKNHFFYNLEPYPDGLLYALSGRNLLIHNNFRLMTEQGSLPIWTTPLYPLVIAMGYFFSLNIAMSYVMNVLLIALFIILFYRVIEKTTSHFYTRVLSVILLLCHSVFIWLPTVTMSESLSLVFFMMLFTAFFEKKPAKKYGILILSLVGLLLTKFALIGLILGAVILFTLQYLQSHQNHRKLIFFIPIISVVLIDLFLRSIDVNGWDAVRAIFETDNLYFGARFILPNLTSYIKMLFYSEGLFLWLNIGLSNGVLFLLFLISIYMLWKKQAHEKAFTLSFLFLAQLPIQLIFYIADARYLIYSIPLIALGITWLVDLFPEKKYILISVTALGILLQLFLQKNLVRQIIADNLLGRSTAWQYEAVQHFNSVLKPGDPVITALPPFLVDTYQTSSYQSLPLSHTQEFMNRSEHIWGNDIDYTDLMKTYKEWVSEGKTLYISNAYITHSRTAITDFETFKKEFQLDLVSAGCDHACDVFRLVSINQ